MLIDDIQDFKLSPIVSLFRYKIVRPNMILELWPEPYTRPIGKPEQVTILDKLPKTRSGKIMRRVLKARALGLSEGDISTLEE